MVRVIDPILRTHSQFTGSGSQHVNTQGPVLQTPPACPLFNRPAYFGTVYQDSYTPQPGWELGQKLAATTGKQRVHMSPWLNNPVYGKMAAAGNKPGAPKHSLPDADLGMKDIPFPHLTADPVYRQRLFVDPFFRPVPYATNAQLYGPNYLNTMVA